MDYIDTNEWEYMPASLSLIDSSSLDFSVQEYVERQNKEEIDARVKSHQYIIDRCAKTKNTNFISKEILVAYGKLGLVEAASTYEESISKSFDLFAHEKIDAAINQALAEKVEMEDLKAENNIKQKLEDINSIYA